MVMEVELKSYMSMDIHMVEDIRMKVRIDTKEERISFKIHMEEHNCILKVHKNQDLICKDSLEEHHNQDLPHIHIVTKE